MDGMQKYTSFYNFCIINKLYRCYIDTNNSNFVIVLKGHLYLEIIAMCVNTECDFEDLLDFVFYDSGLPLVLKCNCDEDFYNKSFKL